MKFIAVVFLGLSYGMLHAKPTIADEFKKREAQIAQFKSWLDALGPLGSQFWIRLDAKRRPHRLYLGDGFYQSDFKSQEWFIDTYSHYLAGHPEKFMLIDLFDAATNKPMGEYASTDSSSMYHRRELLRRRVAKLNLPRLRPSNEVFFALWQELPEDFDQVKKKGREKRTRTKNYVTIVRVLSLHLSPGLAFCVRADSTVMLH
jgi:hypothetical protein